MLCLIDNLNISPYQMLMQGLRDEAKDMGRSEDMTIVQMGLSEFVADLSIHNFSRVNGFKEKIEKLIGEGGYDTVFCMQEQFFNSVIMQTGLYDKLDNFQWALFSGPHTNPLPDHPNGSSTLKWVIDFPEMISKTADLLQRSVLAGNIANKVVGIEIFKHKSNAYRRPCQPHESEGS